MLDGSRYLSGTWTFRGLPDIGDGSDPRKNISLLEWFFERYRYSPGEVAQLLGVTERSVLRWVKRRQLPRPAAATILALVGARRAELGRWRGLGTVGLVSVARR